MVQQMTDNFWQAEAKSEETRKFIDNRQLLVNIFDNSIGGG